MSTKGMTVEGKKTMIMVAIHAATARLLGGDRVSLGEPTITWSTENLVEEEAAPEEERLDPDAAWRFFPATQASEPRRPVAQCRAVAQMELLSVATTALGCGQYNSTITCSTFGTQTHGEKCSNTKCSRP